MSVWCVCCVCVAFYYGATDLLSNADWIEETVLWLGAWLTINGKCLFCQLCWLRSIVWLVVAFRAIVDFCCWGTNVVNPISIGSTAGLANDFLVFFTWCNILRFIKLRPPALRNGKIFACSETIQSALGFSIGIRSTQFSTFDLDSDVVAHFNCNVIIPNSWFFQAPKIKWIFGFHFCPSYNLSYNAFVSFFF